MPRLSLRSLIPFAGLTVLCAAAAAPLPRYGPGKLLADLDASLLPEVSGLAASRRNPGLLWAHNDSGDGPFVYALDRRGKTRGVFRVPGATAIDWEDMAWGPDETGKGRFLFVGDIGDNARRRATGVVYVVPEPLVGGGGPVGTRTVPRRFGGPVVRRVFTYPDGGAHDAEALLVHPKTGAILVVTKETSGVAGVYRFPPRASNSDASPQTLTRVATVTIKNEDHFFPNRVTGGDIAPDGRRVVLCTYARAYEWTLPASADFETIWKTRPSVVALPTSLLQSEAICYSANGRALLATSEGVSAPLYELRAN